MTTPARQPSIDPAYDHWAGFARVLLRVIGVIRIQWDREGMAPGHPYRHAASMLECYLRERYGNP